MTYQCDDCAKHGDIKELEIKMGGLLCPSCRVILFFPYANDGVYESELYRRREEEKKKENK